MLTLEDVIPLQVTDWTGLNDWPERLRGEWHMFAFAIRHPAGLILFETGFGRDSPRLDERFNARHRPIENELERHGLHRSDVRAIANSHLHFDHCGSNYLFPGIPIYVQVDEYRAAHEPNYTLQRWVDFDGAEYLQIEGDREIAPGVKLLTTRGHTPGHQSLLVETNSGLVVLTGQAIWGKTEYEYIRDTGKLLPEYLNPGEPEDDYFNSAMRLINLPARRILFSHDSTVVGLEQP